MTPTLRCLLCLVVAIGLSRSVPALGQSDLVATRVRTDGYPTITVEVLRLGGNVQLLPIDSASLTIDIDGRPLPPLSVICPPPSPPALLSSVLTIDVSGSMAKGAPNIALAREAARAWIRALSEGSECAVTSFDNRHYLNADFTNDTTTLLRSIDALTPRGGTDFHEGFLGAPFGGLNIAAAGRNRRVVVFLTDGNGNGDANDIIAAAKATNTTVYCVSLGMAMPLTLRRAAEETGGLWYENVTTVAEAVLAYRRIFAAATGAGGCTVTVRVPPGCTPTTTATIRAGQDSAVISIPVPTDRIARLLPQPAALSLGMVRPDSTVERTVTVTALNGPQTVRSIGTRTPGLVIDAPTLPYALEQGASMTLRLRWTRKDTSYAIGRVDVVGEPCGTSSIYLTQGSSSLPPRERTLRVTTPNGGERFRAGTVVDLGYEGVPLDVPVQLDVSVDGGQTWTMAGAAVTGGSTRWRLPDTSSTTCLLRVTQSRPAAPSRSTPVRQYTGSRLQAVDVAPNGTIVATAGWGPLDSSKGRSGRYGKVHIWDRTTGTELAVYDGGYDVLITPDSRHVISWGDEMVHSWDIATRRERWAVRVIPTNGAKNVEASADGRLILVVGGWGDTTMVLDAATGATVVRLPRATPDVAWATMSPAGDMVAVCDGDSAVHLYDIPSGRQRHRITVAGVSQFYRAAFHPNGTQLAIAAGNGVTSLYDVATGAHLRDMARRQYVNDNTYLAFSPDGSRMAVETGRDQTKIVDVATGKELVTMQRTGEAGPATNAVYSPDGSWIALTSFYRATVYDAATGVQVGQFKRTEGHPVFVSDGSAVIVPVDEPVAAEYELRPPILQRDSSDAFWTIERSRIRLADVRFATRPVGTAADSVVAAAIVNRGPRPLTVVRMGLEGSQAGDFAIRTTLPVTIGPNDSVAIEYGFLPAARGERAAMITLEADDGLRVGARMTGRGLGRLLAETATLDFGTLDVGSSSTTTLQDAIRNDGDVAVTILRLRKAGPDDSSFVLLTDGPIVLQPGASTSVRASFTALHAGRSSGSIDVTIEGLAQPLRITMVGNGVRPDAGTPDPTTFRGIALPTSIVPPAGTITTGIYDVAGISLGASLTDNVMVLAGGMLPFSNRWIGARGRDASISGAASLGAKVGFRLDDEITVGGGYQGGRSWYDQDYSPSVVESEITFHALWSTIGIGTDEHRLNLTLGYAFKRHVTAYEGTFDADATIVGIGYDYRVARQWKVCGEAFFMRTMPFVPVSVVARYFGETYALEAGVMITAITASGAAPSPVPVLPLLSWVKRW